MHEFNLPTAPGALLGYRKDGRPFYLIAGGSGEDGGNDGNSSTQDAGNDGADDDQQDQGGNDGGDGSGSRDDAGTGRDDRGRYANRDDDTEHTARTVAAIRDDFKSERAKRQAAEKELGSVKAAQTKLQEALDADKADRAKQMDALAVALGIKSGDEPPDPEKLAAELKAAQEKAQTEISQRDTAIKQSKIELAVLRSAGKHGAIGDALLDSRSFMAKANGLDPSAESFADDLAEAIKGAVENGPQYKAAPAGDQRDDAKDGSGQNGNGQNSDGGKKSPARSGGEHTTPGGNRQWTAEEAREIGKSDPPALLKAQEAGLLVDLGYHPARNRK